MGKKLGFIFFIFFGLRCLAQEGSSAIDIQLGHSKLRVFLGNIVDQKTGAIVVSHAPDAVNDAGGVGGAVIENGGAESFEALQRLMKAKGNLPYTSVYSAKVPSGQRIKAETIFNVIELEPQNRIRFDTVAELEASEFPLPPKVTTKYREFLAEHQNEFIDYKNRYQVALDEALASRNVVRRLNLPVNDELEVMRSAIIKDHVKAVGFDTVVETVYNTLVDAERMGIKSVSIPTLGYGVMGDLNMKESIEAIATAIQLHQKNKTTNPGIEAVEEVRVVLYAQDSAKNRKEVREKLTSGIVSGEFLTNASKMMPRMNNLLREATEDFNRPEAKAARAALENASGWRGFLSRVTGWGSGTTNQNHQQPVSAPVSNPGANMCDLF